MQKKTVQPPAKTFFFFCGDHVFLARKKNLNLRLQPAEKAFEIRQRPFFWRSHVFGRKKPLTL